MRLALGCLLIALSLLSLRAQPSSAEALAAFAGNWAGTVTAPNATAAIAFRFTPKGNALATAIHMPDMFLTGADLGPAQLEGGTLRFRPLDVTLRREGDRLVGTFGLSDLPLALHRVEKFPTSPASLPPDAPAGPAPRWSVSLGADLWASPVSHGNALYLGAADGRFHALAADTGRILWTWSGPNPLHGAALVSENAVYVLDSQHDLIRLDARDGTLAWRRPLHDAALAGPRPDNATFNRRTPTPLLHAGTLIVGSSDGGLYAVDPESGAIRWWHDAKTKIYATVAVDRHELLVAGLDGTLLAFDPIAQKETRRIKLPGPLSAAPVIAGDRVVVGCRNYTLYGLERPTFARAWEFSFWFSWIESVPALVDGTLYIGGSDFARVRAIDPRTGRARWSTVVNGLTWGTPLVTSDTVFAGTSAQAGAILPHTGALVALDRATGVVKWRTPFPLRPGASRAGIVGSLALAGESVIAATFDGTVAAYPTRR